MRRRVALLALFMVALLLSGCGDRPYGDKTVIEWSRARRLGSAPASSSEPPALAVAPDGQWIALAWVASPEQGRDAVHLTVLDAQGTVRTDLDLDLETDKPSAPLLLPAGAEALHLLWLDESEHIDRLFHAQLTLDGQQAEPPRQLSAAGHRVYGYDAAVLPTGELLVVWSSRDGLWAARILGSQAQISPQMLEAPGAGSLDVQVDDKGAAHVAWQQTFSRRERRLYYSRVATDSLLFQWPMYLSTLLLQGGGSVQGSAESLQGPVLAIEADEATVIWTVARGETGEGRGFFATFVPGEVKELVPRRLAVSPGYQPDYAAASGSPPYRQLAPPLPLDKIASATPVHTLPATTQGQVHEIALAASLVLRTRWSPQIQPALLVVKAGRLEGFQVVAWTRHPSLHPTLAADGQGHLYYAWLDAEGREFAVYLASTAPALCSAWDSLTSTDLQVALERLFGRLVSAVALIVVALSWLILPGFFLLAALFVLREDTLLTTGGRVVFLVLVGLHWAGKYLVTPEILTMLPRLSDLPLIFPLLTVLAPHAFAYLPNQLHLPPFVAPWLSYLVPSLSLLAALSVTRLFYLRRTRRPNLVLAYMFLIVIDLFLSLELYALTYHDPIKF